MGRLNVFGERKIADFCRQTTYLHRKGQPPAGYLDHEAFEAAGIAVEYMDYDVPAWPQCYGAFTPYVSALDMIAHIPSDARMSYIRPATLAWRNFLDQRT